MLVLHMLLLVLTSTPMADPADVPTLDVPPAAVAPARAAGPAREDGRAPMMSPTAAAVAGACAGLVGGAFLGIGPAAMAAVMAHDANVALAAWAATMFVGAGVGSGFARYAAGDEELAGSAGVVTTLGASGSALFGAWIGSLLGGSVVGDPGPGGELLGGVIGFAAGTLVGTVASPLAHGALVDGRRSALAVGRRSSVAGDP